MGVTKKLISASGGDDIAFNLENLAPDFGTGTNAVYGYDLWPEATDQADYPQTSNFVWFNSGSNFMAVDYTHGKLYKFTCSTAYDISTASVTQTHTLTTYFTTCNSMAMNPAGTKIFIGEAYQDVRTYNLSTAFDLSTISTGSLFEHTNGGSSFIFNDDGTTFYVVNGSGSDDDATPWTLTTAYDLSTGTEGSRISLGSITIDDGVCFLEDGARLWFSGAPRNYSWPLSTDYDISTLGTRNGGSDIHPQFTSPFVGQDSGTSTELYVSSRQGTTTRSAIEEAIIGFDAPYASGSSIASSGYMKRRMSSKNFGNNINVVTAGWWNQRAQLSSTFNADGTKYYRSSCGTSGNIIHQYDLSTAYDIGSISSTSATATMGSYSYYATGSLRFNSDGTKLAWYEGSVGDYDSTSNGTNELSIATLSTGYDLSSLSSTTTAVMPSAISEMGVQAIPNADMSEFTFVIDDYSGGTAPFPQKQSFSTVSLSSAGNPTTVVRPDNWNSYDYGGAGYSTRASSQMVWNANGTKLLATAGGSTDAGFTFSLSTAYSVDYSNAPTVTTNLLDQIKGQGKDYGYNGANYKLEDFNADGTKAFFIASGNSSIVQYDLSTGFDLSTLDKTTAVTNFFALNGQTILAHFWKSDGTKLYTHNGSSSCTFYEYDCSTAWDVSTADVANVSSFTDTNTTNGSKTGLWFKSDGTKMYVRTSSGPNVRYYDLSTAWDITSATVPTGSNNDDIINSTLGSGTNLKNSQGSGPIAFNNTGTQLLFGGISTSGSNNYHHYVNITNLSTAWDVSTAGAWQSPKYVFGASRAPMAGMMFNSTGTELTVANSYGSMYTFGCTTANDLTTGTVNMKSAYTFYSPPGGLTGETGPSNGASNPNIGGFCWTDSGNSFTWGCFNNSTYGFNPGIAHYDCSTAYAIETASNERFASDSKDLVYAITAPSSSSLGGWLGKAHGAVFSNSGTKLFVKHNYTSSNYDHASNTATTHRHMVSCWTLSTAYDVSTASYTYSTNISVLASYPSETYHGININPAGTKLYVCGEVTSGANSALIVGTMTTANDLSTISWAFAEPSGLGTFAAKDGSADRVDSLAFNNDGSKVLFNASWYDGSDYNRSVHQVWDVGTAYTLGSLGTFTFKLADKAYDYSGDVDDYVRAACWAQNGTKLFAVDGSGQGAGQDGTTGVCKIRRWDASSPYDVSTLTYDSDQVVTISSAANNPYHFDAAIAASDIHLSEDGDILFIHSRAFGSIRYKIE